MLNSEESIDNESSTISVMSSLSNSDIPFDTFSSTHSSCSRANQSAGVLIKKKKTLKPPSPQNIEDELSREIMRSRSYGECDLSALHLTVVPSGLSLQSLTLLNLSQNNLVELPHEMFINSYCPHLSCLNINSNRLEHLPNTLFYLPKLKILMLNGNNITTLPRLDPDRKILPSLERVGLENNKLRQFPIFF
ncbi:unnamed protein product [Phytomonas sp. Hart1]|nr:unnamed protein product [Phytomonas sp. Hart1]|eukprot:CCW68781.1 unnamed protein product [Phytomonas sp. isolate Hart1]